MDDFDSSVVSYDLDVQSVDSGYYNKVQFPTLSAVASQLGFSDCVEASTANIDSSYCDSQPLFWSSPGVNGNISGRDFTLSLVYAASSVASTNVRQNFTVDSSGNYIPVGRSVLLTCNRTLDNSSSSSCLRSYNSLSDFPIYYGVSSSGGEYPTETILTLLSIVCFIFIVWACFRIFIYPFYRRIRR